MEISIQSSQQLVQALQSQSQTTAALKTGDIILAKVVGQTQNGSTLLALAGKQVPVTLSTPPSLGTVLNLVVQSTTDGLRLSIVSQTPPSVASNLSPPLGVSSPAVQNSLSPHALQFASAAQPSNSAAQAASVSTSPQSTFPVVTQANNNTVFIGRSLGDNVIAQVVGRSPAGQTVLTIGNQQLAVTLPSNFPLGTTLPLQVTNGSQGLQLTANLPFGATATSGATGTSGPAASSTLAPTGAQPAGTTAPLTPPALAAPSAALTPLLAQTAISALGNQNSVAALLAVVLRLGNRDADLPASAKDAVMGLKNSALNLSTLELSPQALKTAIARSGVFMESQLANSAGPSGSALQGDIKSLLLVLKGSLSQWLGETPNNPAINRPPPPPERGVNPKAGRLENFGMPLQDGEQNIGSTLLAKTDSALSRLHLLQLASLHDVDRTFPASKSEWQIELPFTFGQNAGTLNMQITRDEHQNGQDASERGWHMRFALNPGKMGEVGADISFLSGNTNVVLWAERPETLDAIKEALPDLSEALSSQGLTVGAIRVRKPTSTTQTPNQEIHHYVDLGA